MTLDKGKKRGSYNIQNNIRKDGIFCEIDPVKPSHQKLLIIEDLFRLRNSVDAKILFDLGFYAPEIKWVDKNFDVLASGEIAIDRS
jgi:hypothetical protein